MRPLRHSRTCRYNHTGFSYWKVKPVFFSPRGRGAHVTGRCERRGSKAQGVDTENAAPPSKSIRPFCRAESGQDEMRVKSRIKEGGKRARGHPGVGAAASQSPGTRGAFGHSSGAKPERRGNLPEEERPFEATGAKGSKLGAQRPNPVPSQVVSDTSMPKTFKLADFAHTHARTLQTYLLSPAYSERNLWLRRTHVPARWLELGGGPP